MYPTDSQRREAAIQRHQTRYKAASSVTRNIARLKRLTELTEKAERLGIRDGCQLGSGTEEGGQAVIPPNSGSDEGSSDSDARARWAARMQQQYNEANNTAREGGVSGDVAASSSHSQGRPRDAINENADRLKNYPLLEGKVAKIRTPPDVTILQKNLRLLTKVKNRLSNFKVPTSSPIDAPSPYVQREAAFHDKVSNLLTTHQAALSILEKIEGDGPPLRDWMSKAIRTFQSMEHLVPTVLNEWNDAKKKITALSQLGKDLKLICDESFIESNKFTSLINTLKMDWRILKGMKQAYFARDKKILCSICVGQDVDFVLTCGHPFCGSCVEQLTRCATCREPITGMIKIYWQL